MKRVFLICAQDMKRLLTNALFWVLTGTLAVIVLVVDLALPKEAAQQNLRVYTYQAPAAFSAGEAVESRDALRQAVREGDAVGFSFGEGNITIVHPGYSAQTLEAIALELSGVQPAPVATKTLNETAKEIPFHLTSTPIFICFEALMVGFILGGALMLSEKQDGTVLALRVSPLNTATYIVSKTLLFSLIGTVYASLIGVLTVGFSIHWGMFLLLSFVGTAIFTMIGLAYTTPFRDMSGWFFSMVVLLSVNMLPVISYSSPAFTPCWMKLIPSYPILMAYRSALFGESLDLRYTLIAMVVWLAASYLLAQRVVWKRHVRRASR